MEQISAPDLSVVVDHVDPGDPDRPWSVWVDPTEQADAFEVNARRPDHTILTIVRGIAQPDALRVAARVRDAIVHDEAWVTRLIDSSAGKLRQ